MQSVCTRTSALQEREVPLQYKDRSRRARHFNFSNHWRRTYHYLGLHLTWLVLQEICRLLPGITALPHHRLLLGDRQDLYQCHTHRRTTVTIDQAGFRLPRDLPQILRTRHLQGRRHKPSNPPPTQAIHHHMARLLQVGLRFLVGHRLRLRSLVGHHLRLRSLVDLEDMVAHLLHSLWLRTAMVLRQVLINTLLLVDMHLLLDPLLSLGMDLHPNNLSILVRIITLHMEVDGKITDYTN